MILTLEEYKKLSSIGNTADDQVELVLETVNGFALNYINRSEIDDLSDSEKSGLKLIFFQLANSILSTISKGSGDISDGVGQNTEEPLSTGEIKNYTFEGNSVSFLTRLDDAAIKKKANEILIESLGLLNDYRRLNWGSF